MSVMEDAPISENRYLPKTLFNFFPSRKSFIVSCSKQS